MKNTHLTRTFLNTKEVFCLVLSFLRFLLCKRPDLAPLLGTEFSVEPSEPAQTSLSNREIRNIFKILTEVKNIVLRPINIQPVLDPEYVEDDVGEHLVPKVAPAKQTPYLNHHSYHLQIILHHHGLHVLREVFAEALLGTGGGREDGGAGDSVPMRQCFDPGGDIKYKHTIENFQRGGGKMLRGTINLSSINWEGIMPGLEV